MNSPTNPAAGMEPLWAQRGKALAFVALLGVVFSANYTNHGPLVEALAESCSWASSPARH